MDIHKFYRSGSTIKSNRSCYAIEGLLLIVLVWSLTTDYTCTTYQIVFLIDKTRTEQPMHDLAWVDTLDSLRPAMVSMKVTPFIFVPSQIFAVRVWVVGSCLLLCWCSTWCTRTARLVEELIFGRDNLSWMSGSALSEAGLLADYMILKTGMTALGKVYYRTQQDLMLHVSHSLGKWCILSAAHLNILCL